MPPRWWEHEALPCVRIAKRALPAHSIAQGGPFDLRALVVVLAIVAFAFGAARAGAITVPAPEVSPALEASPSGEQIRALGYSSVGSPGNPALPFKDL